MSVEPKPNEYLLGQVVKLSSVFTTPAGAPVDPSEVAFGITKPDATETIYVYLVDVELVRDGVGVYHVNWLTAEEGEHCYGFIGTGTAQALQQQRFVVNERCFPIPA